MKKCVQCHNDLPDTAVHCVYCGAKQPAVAGQAAAPNARTVMGYPGMAQDVARQAGVSAGAAPGGKASARPGARDGVSGFDATQPVSNDGFRDGAYGPPGQPGQQHGQGFGPGPGQGPGPYGVPIGPHQGHGSQPHHFAPPPGMGGPQQGYGPGPYQGGPPPGYGQPQGYGPGGPGQGGPQPGAPAGPHQGLASHGSQPHHFAPPPGMGGPQQGYGAPGYGPPMNQPSGPPQQGYGPGPQRPGPSQGYGPPMHAPHPQGSPPQGYNQGGPEQGGPGPYGQPHPQGYGPGPHGPPGYGAPGSGLYENRPETEPVKPLRPPYLASESHWRASSPIEPWTESLKTLMLVFGVLLVACFVAPWRVQPGATTFSWTILSSDVPASMKILPILLVATGALAVLLGAFPLPTIGRGFLAAGLGLAPIVYLAVAPEFDWRGLVGLIGAVTLVAGLLVRSQYTGAMAGRLMTTLGAICIILPVVIPAGGALPLVEMFKLIGQAPGSAKVVAMVQLVPVVLALVAMVVWLPPPSHAGATILAWIFIAWPLVAAVTMWLVGGELGATLKTSLDGILYLPLAVMAWSALTGFGVATVVGKQLEQV